MRNRRAQAANIKYIPNGKRATDGLNWPKKRKSSRGLAKNNEHDTLRVQATNNRSHTTTATKTTLKTSQTLRKQQVGTTLQESSAQTTSDKDDAIIKVDG